MIKNRQAIIFNTDDKEQQKQRGDILDILEHVLKEIDPYKLVKDNVELESNKLKITDFNLDLEQFDNIYVLGAGKAVYKMALAVERILGDRITGGYINIPELPARNELKIVKVNKASHPIPSSSGVFGSRRIKKALEKAGKDDLIIAVISGGGSALMPLPAEGISLKEKTSLTSLLLKTPATIHEINVVRKHLSQMKGGQFACHAYPATVIGLYISDIVGDDIDAQASGPTAPDNSSFKDSVDILKKYGVWKKVGAGIKRRLELGVKGMISETPDEKHKVFVENKVHNFTIGNHQTAVSAAVKKAEQLGYNTLELTSSIQGEAREVSKVIISIGEQVAKSGSPIKKPAIIIAGGETTVTVKGKGKGGRNQELVLSGVLRLRNGMALASFGTDGVDGFASEQIAGAIADFGTFEKGLKKKIEAQSYLSNNDSYHYFKKLGGGIKTGYTGTNVGDLILLSIV